MTYPKLDPINRKSKQYLMQFAGLNGTYARADGEMRDMKNLTSTYTPYIAPRGPRRRERTFNAVTYVGAKDDKFFWVDQTQFVYDGIVKGTVAAGEKQIVTMNDFIIIFPDKKHYDVVNDRFENMELTFNATSIAISNVKDSGECKIIAAGANFQGLKKGDGIKFTGCQTAYNNRSAIIKEYRNDNTLIFDENTFKDATETNVTIKREIPDMEFVIEAENRLWGCKGNELYASKQGDHLNFNVFAGIATDSYATSVGSDGPFTAAANYSNNIIFFKEDCIHRVFGSKPSNYQVITTNTQGVQKGCHKSLAIANEVLFYKARKGICAYNGSLPELISEKLGYVKYKGAVAGSNGKKYYCSLERENGYDLCVFDALKNLWHKEDTTQAKQFVTKQGELYFVNTAGTELTQVESVSNEVIEWKAALGPFNETVGEKKGYSKLQIRATLEAGSSMEVWISHNGMPYEIAHKMRYTSDEMRYVLIQVRRCDYFDVELRGTGPCKVKSMIREFFVGSDV